MKTMPYFQGTGSRKTSVARVRLVPGEGTVVVNGKPLEEYFGRDGYSEAAVQPFVNGGGESGQLGAIRHAIARALLQVDAEHRAVLRKAGLLTRDPRAKERKKPGLKRARKAPQFTKR